MCWTHEQVGTLFYAARLFLQRVDNQWRGPPMCTHLMLLLFALFSYFEYPKASLLLIRDEGILDLIQPFFGHAALCHVSSGHKDHHSIQMNSRRPVL